MPNNANLHRQRFLGGALGVIVLGFALTYHFFPRLFHVSPGAACGPNAWRRSANSMPDRR
jgi:hypothetical protein